MIAEAIAEVEKAYELSGGEPHDAALLGYTYAVTGRRADAQALLERLQVQSRQQYVSYYYIAEIFTGLGDADQAFKWLNKACDQREGLLLYLKVYPIFDGLRADLRYKELVQRSAIP
jgi:tetratricopeptide (TPR) repeat protein